MAARQVVSGGRTDVAQATLESAMGMFDLLRQVDVSLLPDRYYKDTLERPPADWERWVAEHDWQAAVGAAVVVGLVASTIWTLTDYQFQMNDFLLRALGVGVMAFGLAAWAATDIAASVRVRDRLREREEASEDDI